ncbi:hypothetical protein HanXRQr2_Chr10g0463601 [Helianthus annuus]|uniref:Uncharacterized protein n=1 Tax=Helianthus annuus TaxID=4232 RepID=A0A9K3I253_HELAN|nr:hypothetical protein HanXRQr2_Chr10g0463601 [Helianthus annuus]KAJ0523968.1 hypothetical protein HanIR_Chr10g0499471 [Helianthus annuus]KAJ0885636.1 hypothetical protein HanPSC8_Chr10g0447381 [Helianthus annuus]
MFREKADMLKLESERGIELFKLLNETSKIYKFLAFMWGSCPEKLLLFKERRKSWVKLKK